MVSTYIILHFVFVVQFPKEIWFFTGWHGCKLSLISQLYLASFWPMAVLFIMIVSVLRQIRAASFLAVHTSSIGKVLFNERIFFLFFLLSCAFPLGWIPWYFNWTFNSGTVRAGHPSPETEFSLLLFTEANFLQLL